MGFTRNDRKFPLMTSIALARSIIAEAAASEPAKVVARKVGKTPRHVRNIAAGNIEVGVTTAVLFAQHYPNVKKFFATVLALEQRDPQDEALLEQMRQWIASQQRE